MKTKHWSLALFAWNFYNKSKKNDEDRARQQKHQDKISADAKRQADTQRPW